MFNRLKDNPAWAGSIVLLYAGPFFLWMFLAVDAIGFSKGWMLFGVGLLMVLAGSLALILIQQRNPFPKKVVEAEEPQPAQAQASPAPLHETSPEIENLRRQLQEQAQEIANYKEENVALKNQNFQAANACNALKEELESIRSRPNEPYQERIFELENQVEDLKYELRSILNLNTADLASIEEEDRT